MRLSPSLAFAPVLVAASLFAAGMARADEVSLTVRPRFQVAVGMGASIDRAPPNPTPGRPLPAFFFSAGLGDGFWGADVRSFGNGASQSQVSRLSLEIVAAVRPLVLVVGAREGYLFRVARSLSVTVGPAYEHVSQRFNADGRLGAVLGAHVDLPIGYATARKELRVRLGARRMFGAHGQLKELRVGDSTLELAAQLAFVF